jgi:hypothetical protein
VLAPFAATITVVGWAGCAWSVTVTVSEVSASLVMTRLWPATAW